MKFGPEHEMPCDDPRTIACTKSLCQIAGECQFWLYNEGRVIERLREANTNARRGTRDH